MLYGTVLADPPWKLSGGKNGRGGWSKSASPSVHYPLMKTEDIANLPIGGLAAPDSHLYLWVTNGLLPEGLHVMKSWGYRYVTNLCWGKTSGYGMGQYFRTQHELLLFGVRGKVPYSRDLVTGKRKQARSLVLADRGAHSEKPEEFRKVIELVSPGPFVELFARKKVPGWHAWGNEIESDVEIKQVG